MFDELFYSDIGSSLRPKVRGLEDLWSRQSSRQPKVRGTLHIRLVGDLEDRIRRIEGENKLAHNDALQFVLNEDKARSRYVKTHFNADVANHELYDVVLNTSRLNQSCIVETIAGLLQRDCRAKGG